MALWTALKYGKKPDGTTSPYPKDFITLLAVRSEGHETPPEIEALLEIGKVTLGWSADKPVKRLPQSSLAKLRKTRRKNQLKKKFPLFWQDFYNAELAARPDYFNGVRPNLKNHE
ncbi:MAG: hypothetical protein COA69_13495 [Robiginitomaculum sp.]|nr:MAG: hypothetical protein COA69_13495 [Robiginitomaculum sp.]